MMRRSVSLGALGLAALVAGCSHVKSSPKSRPPDDHGVQSRAKEAQEGLKRQEKGLPPKPRKAPEPIPVLQVGEEAAQGLFSAPEATPRRAQELGKDPAGCTWIESEATVTVGEQDSRHQVHAAAVAQARQAAMQDFLGVDVKSRFMDFQQETLRDQQSLTESMLLTTRLGRILNEKVVSENYLDLPGCPGCRYRLVLRSCLMPIPDYADKDFHVELGVSPRTKFIEGDEAKLTVTASRDCYVYLYNVGTGGETSLLVPNEILHEVKLKAGETWVYPSEEIQKRGVHLVAQLPEGRDVSAETVRVVAAKTPLSEKTRDPSSGDFLGILRRMNVSRVDWAEDAQAFTISKH